MFCPVVSCENTTNSTSTESPSALGSRCQSPVLSLRQPVLLILFQQAQSHLLPLHGAADFLASSDQPRVRCEPVQKFRYWGQRRQREVNFQLPAPRPRQFSDSRHRQRHRAARSHHAARYFPQAPLELSRQAPRRYSHNQRHAYNRASLVCPSGPRTLSSPLPRRARPKMIT